jgi:hypothetical protein
VLFQRTIPEPQGEARTQEAVVAVGHKMLRVVYSMMKRGEVYRDHTVDFQELMVKKNASRWIKQLTKYNLLN